MMRVKSLISGSILGLWLLTGGAMAAMAQGVGAIGGSVSDPTGGVLPGVTVTLNNAQGTVGGRQTTQTDERGA
jgi:hypothetical protein